MLRSDAVTQGIQRSPNRAMLRAVGFGDEDFGKPILGIANGYSTITPCNVGLDDLSKRAVEAAHAAGVSIPTGCLGGSCGACEIEINGELVRACISSVPNSNEPLQVELASDPYW